ncbi:lycopene cyclase domain-containing protein [Demequina lutea]|uniref:Lycopene cyclase domain-containing protein n=1 Tax=Demequina lutea TaxID=431489 RepID=A0A7Y9Z9A0_9MICO|nr:lycopene cyclase domain-containing protein [Demequina lutea]NYI39983.1 lycopene cyclase domain-containing protein [Demequina lutea]
MSSVYPGGAYLAALFVSLAGLGLLDRRYCLALFADARRTLATVGIGVAVFLVWDLEGVGLGIFFRGDSRYLTGIQVAPEVPLEELFFLTLLVYQTLLLWLAFSRRPAARRPDITSDESAR